MTQTAAQTTTNSILRKLVEAKLEAQGKKLTPILLGHRRAKVGFRRIATDIRDRTGVVVSHTTVARWIEEINSRAAAGK